MFAILKRSRNSPSKSLANINEFTVSEFWGASWCVNHANENEKKKGKNPKFEISQLFD